MATKTEFKRTFFKLANIARPDALILLRYSLSAKKLVHTLQSCLCVSHQGLVRLGFKQDPAAFPRPT